MKKSYLLALVAVAGMMLAGCEAIQHTVNPMPRTSGSRVAPRLEQLPRPNPAQVKSVTVYRFDNKTGFPHGLQISHGMTDQLITALVKSGHFSVVERATLPDLQTERGMQEGGMATDEVRGRQLEGAHYIFTGAVTELDETGGGGIGIDRRGYELDVRTFTAQVGLDMRVIEVSTGRVLDSIDVRRTVRDSGVSAGIPWGLSGDVRISNAMDLAIRETIDEAVYELVTRYGAF